MAKVLRDIIEIDEALCDGCGECISACAEGALEIVDGKARLKGEILCDGAGACIGHCPTGALKVIKRESEAYDEVAVQQHLGTAPQNVASVSRTPAGPILTTAGAGGGMGHGHGCPGSALRQFGPRPAASSAIEPAADNSAALRERPSRLAQWPVQLMLIPPHAPFLQDANLLITADCVPFAFADFHDRFLRERALLVGCPKLDDLQHYLEKLTAIFRQNHLHAVEVVKMEVPCCSGIAQAAVMARREAGSSFPMTITTIGVQGEILETCRV